jgi:hypothetical protein
MVRISTLRTRIWERGTPGKLVIVLNWTVTVTRTPGRPFTVIGVEVTVGVGLKLGADPRAAAVTFGYAASGAEVGSAAYRAPARAQFSIAIV